MIQMDDHFRAVAGGATPSGYEPTGRTTPDDDGARWCSTCKLDVPIAAYCTNCGKDFGAFRGFTSGKTHRDRWPWLSETSEIRYRLEPDDGFGPYRYAPRPEFDNHNPILVELRRCVDLGASLLAMVQVFRNWYRFGKAEKIPASLAQSDHAWRVLTKLAALTTDKE